MFITHNDAQIYAVAFGSSPRTLLALGGWAGSWEVWTETFCHLSETWRAAAYDHRGTGATTAPIESITVENMTNDVFVVMEALKVERCVLACESAGAVIALNAVLQQPQRFQGLVIVDGLYNSPMPDETDPFVQGLKHYFGATIAQFVNRCVPEPDSEAIRRWGRQILARSEQAAAIRLYECVYGVDLRPRLGEIQQPTLIIHGDLDRLVSVEAARWLAEHIPNAQLEILEGAGHVPTVTRPREVAEAINRWGAAF
jgi:pimeloyl-ACP methyl ester carboxylesterase